MLLTRFDFRESSRFLTRAVRIINSCCDHVCSSPFFTSRTAQLTRIQIQAKRKYYVNVGDVFRGIPMQEFIHARRFDSLLELKKLDERLITDGQYVYFTKRERMGIRQHGGSVNSVGNRTLLYRLEGVKAAEFKKQRQGNGFVVYTDGHQEYISVYGDDQSFHFSLYQLRNTVADAQITSDDIAVIRHKKKFLKTHCTTSSSAQ